MTSSFGTSIDAVRHESLILAAEPDSRRSVKTVRAQTVLQWTEVDAVVPTGEGTTVTFTHHYEFPDTELLSTSTLRFRSAAEIRDSLALAGFTIVDIFGGWNHEPVGEGDGELLVLAGVGRRD